MSGRRHMEEGIMNAPFTVPVTIGKQVPEFLHQHNAEEAFRVVSEIVRDCYPEARNLTVEVDRDVYDLARRYVILWVTLPADHSTD